MNETKVIAVEKLAQPSCRSVLDQLVQEGARRMLQSALENEVDEYIQAHGSWDPKTQRQMVVRNGRLPQREILTGAGPGAIEQPRVRHRDGRQEKFSSAILPLEAPQATKNENGQAAVEKLSYFGELLNIES